MRLTRIGLVIALVATLALFALPWGSQRSHAQGLPFPSSVYSNFCWYGYPSDGLTGTSVNSWFGQGSSPAATWSYSGGTFTSTNEGNDGSGTKFAQINGHLAFGATYDITEAWLLVSVSGSQSGNGYTQENARWHTSGGPDTGTGADTTPPFNGDYSGQWLGSSWGNSIGPQSATSLDFSVFRAVGASYSPGVLTVTDVVFCGQESFPPTFTPTPAYTPTPTPTPTQTPPPIPALANYDSCPLMGDQNANTSDGARWNLHGGAFGIVPPPGFDITTGYVDQLLTLSRYNKYIVTLKYRQTVVHSNQAIIFSLGSTPGITVPLTADLNEQTFTAPAANYEPTTQGSADSYDFFIGQAAVASGNDLILTYACISDETATNSLGIGAKALATLCQSCTYEPGTIEGLGDIINNIVKLLQWLWCGFSQIWDCSVRPFFVEVLAIIAIIIAAIAFIRQWVAIILTNGNAWIGAVLPILAHWVAGFIINVIQALLNAAATLGRSLGLGGLFDFISNLFRNGATILNLIGSWVQTAIQQILNVLTAIPTVFNALVNGYNHTATSTGATAPVCNDTSSILYGPCLGMYVLDNTIFNGPVFYAIPLALGLVAFNTLLWAGAQIRNALTR